MAAISKQDILKLAQLARLTLDESEVDTYIGELNEILTYVEMLKAFDDSGLAPTNQVTGLKNVFRDDEIVDYGYTQKDLMAGVPDVLGDQIKVKRMIG